LLIADNLPNFGDLTLLVYRYQQTSWPSASTCDLMPKANCADLDGEKVLIDHCNSFLQVLQHLFPLFTVSLAVFNFA